MTTFTGYAAPAAGEKLKKQDFTPGPLKDDEVELDVIACGICHSDISMIDNDWGMSSYPLVPGHEVIGRISQVGANVSHLKEGQIVGVGWFWRACLTCNQCMSGKHHHCGDVSGTIVGHAGGFADKVRTQGAWAIPLPDGLDPVTAGPLLCGGVTVFSPIVDYGVLPTDRVGVIGIGGLGSMALQFLKAWGCEVWAFTTSMDKEEQLKDLGAHHVANTRDKKSLEGLKGQFDFILSTVNVELPWAAYVSALAPEGRLVTVGAVLKDMEIPAFGLIAGQKTVGGSDTGSPARMATMLNFAARHNITPKTEVFDMADVNQALDHVRAGKARYRAVLKA